MRSFCHGVLFPPPYFPPGTTQKGPGAASAPHGLFMYTDRPDAVLDQYFVPPMYPPKGSSMAREEELLPTPAFGLGLGLLSYPV